MQLMPGRTQVPQLALQHSKPGPQVMEPHGWPTLCGTQTGSPSITSQVVPSMQSTAAQGLVTSSQSHTSGELFQT